MKHLIRSKAGLVSHHQTERFRVSSPHKCSFDIVEGPLRSQIVPNGNAAGNASVQYRMNSVLSTLSHNIRAYSPSVLRVNARAAKLKTTRN